MQTKQGVLRRSSPSACACLVGTRSVKTCTVWVLVVVGLGNGDVGDFYQRGTLYSLRDFSDMGGQAGRCVGIMMDSLMGGNKT